MTAFQSNSGSAQTLTDSISTLSCYIATLLALFFSCSSAAVTETGRCASFDPQRQLYWGDLHVHTTLSPDAWTSGTRVEPEGAYRFARGEEIFLTPGGQKVQIERPLDFAAITDHASDSGSLRLCTDKASPSYDTEKCARYRAPITVDKNDIKKYVAQLVEKTGGIGLRDESICGKDNLLCLEGTKTVWEETRAAAEKFNGSYPECDFSTLIAYEYTATPDLTKIHRNVIFKNSEVLPAPIAAFDEPDERVLWQRLKNECIDAGTGCDVLAIPHNPNLSNGHLFTLNYPAGSSLEKQKELAALRAAMEPLLEISQMKGDSECRNNMWNVLGGTDEFCDWEKYRGPNTPDCKDGTSHGALLGGGCVSRLDYGRYALVEGLKEKRRIGVNPYKFGFMASTDIHDGTPGATEEWRRDLESLAPNPRSGRTSGGLVAVWAEENSRSAIFDALRRREVYGTSGTRMQIRLFGGRDLSPELCDDPEAISTADSTGVPMGGTLSPDLISDRAPSFLVLAQQDAGTVERPGNKLQRAQIIKGWTDEAGNIHQRVIDIAGGDNKASVDTATCEPTGPGHSKLCGVWRDPDFDKHQDAVYYVRVLENPSCRSTGWLCAAAKDADRPQWCDQESTPLTTQERGWTSAIWYSAGDS